MSARRFRGGVVVVAVACGAGLLAGQRWSDARVRQQRRDAAALLVADSVRVARARGEDPAVTLARLERQTGFRATILCGADTVPLYAGALVPRCAGAPVRPSLLDSLRLDEAPRGWPGGALAPLKDADGWDVVGAVAVTRTGAADLAPGPWPPAPAMGLLLIVALAAWLWRWAGRAPERRRRETLVAWSFLGIPFLHLAVFSFGPLAFTAYLAFHEWSLVGDARPFVGLANFRELAGDPLFWRTLGNTALYTTYVPITMALALGLALLLNRRRGGERLLRTVVFLPFVTSAVAIAIVWQWMFNPDFGLLNYLGGLVGMPSIDWLGSARTALLAIILVTVWTQVGYQMIVFLAGLQGIPQTYYDAARVDGASPWQRFRHVTLPLLRPVVLFVLVTGIISGFQVFTLVYMMTEGGPLHATDVIVYRIYQTAWEFLRFGSASAMALVLFAVLLAVTVVQFKLLGKRVDYT